MKPSLIQTTVFLIAGLFVTLSTAVNTCPPSALNEISACVNITALDLLADPCSSTFKQLACADASFLAALPDDLLVTLSACYSDATILSLDPIYSALFFSKMDNDRTSAIVSQLNSQFTSLSPEWRKFLLSGIWSRIMQNLDSSANQPMWLPVGIQPFLAYLTPGMVHCLQQNSVTCEFLKALEMNFPKMSPKRWMSVYKALSKKGLDCFQNVNRRTLVSENLEMLSESADNSDIAALNGKLSTNVADFSLTDDNIQVLGQLACVLNSSYIESSSGNLLTQLSQCNSFTPDQQSAIQKVISSGNSVLGDPSTWTKHTLNSLGRIIGILNKDILQKIPMVSINAWMTDAIQNNVMTRSQFASIVKKLAPTRLRRATGCPAGMQITAANVNNPLLPLSYSPALLDACLDNQTLIQYLNVLGSDPFTDEQLAVLKMRLDQIYPGGYPDTVISNLGAIMFLCGPADISKWNISSLSTLRSLFAVGPTNSLAQLYIAKYISSGNPLNGTALNIIGNYICLLNSTQLSLITPSALSSANPLDISACNQTVKNALYSIANVSYQPVRNQPATYYNQIKPYLGGAPTADLKSLAALNPNMDIATFENLNPTAVLSLSVSDVKALLGNNIAALVGQQTNPVVSDWIKVQPQSALDTLGLGLQGGIRDYSNTTLSSSTATTATSQPPSSSAPALPESFSLILVIIAGILLS